MFRLLVPRHVVTLLVVALALSCGSTTSDPKHPAGATPATEEELEAMRDLPGLPAGSVRFVPQIGIADDTHVTGVDISPGGRLVLSDTSAGLFQVWDRATGMLVLTVRDVGGPKGSHARFLSDGAVLCSRDESLLTIDLASGNVIGERAASAAITHLAVARSGRWAVSAGGSDLVVWDLDDSGPGQRLEPSGRVDAVAISADGAHVLSASTAGGVVLWDRARGTAIRSHELDERVGALNFDASGERALVASRKAGAFVWDVASGQVARSFASPDWGTYGGAIAPDGATVLLGKLDTYELLSVGSGASLGEFGTGDGSHPRWRFLTFSDDGKVVVGGGERSEPHVLDAKTGKRLARYALEWGGGLESLALDSQGRAFGATRTGLKSWDLAALRFEASTGRSIFRPSSLALSPDEKRVWVSGHQAHEFDVEHHKELRGLGGSRMGVQAVDVSPDGKLLALAGVMSKEPIRLIELGEGNASRALGASDRDQTVAHLSFNHDGSLLVSQPFVDAEISVWDVSGGSLVRTFTAGRAFHIAASPKDARVAVALKDGVKLFDLGSGSLQQDIPVKGGAVALAFSPDGARLAIGSDAGVLLWDLAADKAMATLAGARPAALSFAPDGRLLGAATAEGILRVFAVDRLDTPETAAVSFISRKGEWLAYSDDGYFAASKDGAHLVAFVRGTHAYRPDQFAYRLNRPDVLLSRLGLGAPSFREHLFARHKARLRKAGISGRVFAEGLHVPTASILTAERKGRSLALAFECSDRHLELAGYQVYANGVGLFGLTGKPAAGNKGVFEETVELTGGDNRIEVSCMNGGGGESIRALTLHHVDSKNKPDIYYLGFGVSTYRDKRLNLDYAHKDALDLGKLFERLTSKGYRVHTQVHTDADVTREGIAQAKDFVAGAKPDDLFVLFIAGHGIHARDKDSTYYFVTHDTDPANPSARAADFELIEDLLVGIAPRQKLFLMDTCQSGEDDADSVAAVPEAFASRGLKQRNVRGLVLAGAEGPKRPAARSFLYRRDRFIDNDLRRRSGAVVLSSSRGNESSFESDSKQHGLFTLAVLKALDGRTADRDRNRRVSSRELELFVSKEVALMTGGAQNPTIDRDNSHIDLQIPLE